MANAWLRFSSSPKMSKYYKGAALCSYQMGGRSGYISLLAPLRLLPLEGNQASVVPVSSISNRQKSSFVKTAGGRAGGGYNGQVSSIIDPQGLGSTTRQQENMFSDSKLAYRTKSTWELVRALGFFFMCRFPSFSDNALKIMHLSYSIFGKRLSNFVIRKIVYDQFVAGEKIQEMSEAISKLKRGGVGPILCCPTERFSKDSGLTKDAFYDFNLEKVLGSIEKAMLLDDPFPMVHYRFTAFICGDLLTAISPLCQDTIHNEEVIQGIMSAMNGQAVDFAKMPGWESFPIEKTEEFQVGLRRVGKLNSELEKHDIIALTDAEYTCMNPALRLLGLASMKQCNSGDKAKVFYTYQAYLKSKAEELADDIRFAKTSGFAMGVKLVRGAYMVQERQRAKQGGYPDPVNPDYETTSRSYDSCLNLLLNEAALTASEQHELQDGEASSKVKASGKPGGIRFIIASHNEDSVLYALQRMKDLKIPKDGGTVFFGQLYGMADHVSFVLGMGGYSVYKSIPYGSIGETLPYLARRAQENKAILTNARRERNLIMKTLKDRALLRG